MEIEKTSIKDCFIIKPKVYFDDRGYFFESFNKRNFKELTGLSVEFVQDNQSKSSKGVLRGLHFQKGVHAQAKLVRVLAGSVLDVCVDLRPDSPTFGKHFSIVLDAIENYQLFVPKDFAHGFLVLEDDTVFSYKCDNYYNKQSEGGIYYNDPDLNIDWKFKIEDIRLADKDRELPAFKSWAERMY